MATVSLDNLQSCFPNWTIDRDPNIDGYVFRRRFMDFRFEYRMDYRQLASMTNLSDFLVYMSGYLNNEWERALGHEMATNPERYERRREVIVPVFESMPYQSESVASFFNIDRERNEQQALPASPLAEEKKPAIPRKLTFDRFKDLLDE